MQINIADLVTQSQNGDREASSKLYQLTFKKSYYLASKILGDKDKAYETVEETYRKAFSSIASLKNPENFEAWIKHITAVKCVENLKQSNSISFNSDIYSSVEGIEDGYEYLPAGLEKSANAVKAIDQIITALPDTQRVITLFYYINEMPVNYIAKMLGCTENEIRSELYYSREKIKKSIERIINRETVIYPAGSSPLLTEILQSAEKQQVVDETLARGIFASVTDSMTEKEEPKQTVFEAKNISPNNSEQQKIMNAPDIQSKRSSSSKKLIITVIVSALAIFLAFVIAVAGVIGVPKLISIFKKPDDASAQLIDELMLKNLEPYAENYENLLTIYAEALKEGEEDVSDGNFNFIYFNDNDIPDLTISFKLPFDNSPNLYDSLMICVDGNEEEIFNAVVAMNTWVGQKGYYVVSDTEFEDGEESDAFYKYRYADKNDSKIFSGGLRYDKFLNDEQIYQESWVYMAEADGEMLELSGWDEYYEKKDILLDGFYRVTSGYSIVDFADSGKDLVKYLKKAKPERYVLFEEDDESQRSDGITTQTTQAVSASDVYIDATSDDWETLESDLSKILTFCGKYNYKLNNAYETILPVNCTTLIYSHYFDTKIQYGYANDPLDYFTDSEYCAFDAEDVDWIVSNVFNQAPNHNLKTRERYYYNGKYYVAFYPSSCPITEVDVVSKEKQSDGSYNIALKETYYVGEGYGTEDEVSYIYNCTVKAALKNIDGKKVWSFFSIKSNETETDKKTTVASKPEWESNYNKVLRNYKDSFNTRFTLIDIDENDVPDLVLLDRGAQTDWCYIYFNGSDDEELANMFSATDLYLNSSGEIGYYYYYHSGGEYCESYHRDRFDGVNFNTIDFASHFKGYQDSETKTGNLEYWEYLDASQGLKAEIEKEEYDKFVDDFNNEYSKVQDYSISECLEKGDSLDKYIQTY